jgi:hypothetical protein
VHLIHNPRSNCIPCRVHLFHFAEARTRRKLMMVEEEMRPKRVAAQRSVPEAEDRSIRSTRSNTGRSTMGNSPSHRTSNRKSSDNA